MGKKRKPDKTITFDDSARKSFLTGFRKRKKERREYAQRKEAEETKKQQQSDRLDQRRFKRATKLGISVDELEDLDKKLDADVARAVQVVEEPVPQDADVMTFVDDVSLTTAVVTTFMDDEDDGPALLHGGRERPGHISDVAPTPPVEKKYKPKVPDQKKRKGGKKGAISKKQKARNRAPLPGAPKSNIVRRSK